MNRRPHGGTLAAGVVFVVIGLTFLLEELGVWSLTTATLRVLGPALLILLGAAVLLAGLAANRR
jgi:hypothetical protein